MLVGEIADERLAEQPLAGVNHPAWILGHLAWTADRWGSHCRFDLAQPDPPECQDTISIWRQPDCAGLTLPLRYF
jgi:hypothetical protein